MPTFSSLLGLPAPLLLLLAAQIPGLNAQQGAPTAIRKMGIDPGEKFLHEYVAFADSNAVAQVGTRAQPAIHASSILTPEEEELLGANASALLPFRAPFAAHFFSPADSLDGRDVQDARDLYRRAKLVEARLGKRDYSCPTGTSSCSSIGYPDTCCQSGTTCVTITDTGLGSVGCCPDGESCSGSISCSGDQEGCSSESGGGCCIAGYACASVGCTKTGVATTTITQTTSSSLVTTTQTITSTSSASTTTTTSTSLTATTSTSSAETTVDASAPVRPTSGSSSSSADYCPTGFYACSAVYGGGCCQTGRNCQTTSCPSTASTTIVSANGVTIVVPASDVPATTTAATCASGWSMCPSSAGVTAGCCPSGYSCGTASCFISSASATATVAKELPGSSAGKRTEVAWISATIPALLGFAFGVALI